MAAGTWTNYDVAKANSMLDAAGLKRGSDGTRLDQDGKPMKYDLIVPSGWTDWISACQIISQNMNDLGIEISVTDPRREHLDRYGRQGPVPMGVRLRFGRAHPLQLLSRPDEQNDRPTHGPGRQ